MSGVVTSLQKSPAGRLFQVRPHSARKTYLITCANAGLSFADQMALEVSNVPLRRYADPSDIAAAVAFFLGEESNHVTGHNLVVDGGFTRAY